MSAEVLFKTVFAVLLTTDLVGNTLVILVILNTRSTKNVMNYLLLNLAVADMMACTFFAPRVLFISTFTHPTGTAGDVLCKIITGMNIAWVASLASAFSIVLIAVERYSAVVHPYGIRHRITKRKLKVLVPACWVIAIVLTLPTFTISSYDDDFKTCRVNFPDHWQYVSFTLLWLIVTYIVPVGVMSVLYARVIHSLWFKNNSRDASRLVVINERKRITKTMIILSIVYIVCCATTPILYVIKSFHPNVMSVDDPQFKIGFCLLVLNYSINPLIYSFQSKEFRKYLKKLMCCNRQVGQQPTEASTKAKDPSVSHRDGPSSATRFCSPHPHIPCILTLVEY